MKLAHALRTHSVPALAALALLAGPTVPPITRTGPKNTRGTRHDYAFRFVLFFVAFVSIGLPKGQTFATGQNTPTGRTIPVPVGKRLVIQMVSVWRSGTLTPGEGVRAYIGCMVNGHEIFYPLPFAPTDGTAVPGMMQAVILYADSGTDLEFNAFRSGASGDETDLVSVTGYLVDVP